jgi:hypothetical protein
MAGRSEEMKAFHQQLKKAYNIKTRGVQVDHGMTRAEGIIARDESRERRVGKEATGKEFYCVSCDTGYDEPGGSKYDPACPHCDAEHCDS